MDTKQINDLCFKRYSNFLGCLPIDDLKKKNIREQLCNNFNVGSVLIFNIDESSKSGTHWVLLHRLVGGNLFIFYSFGAFGSNSVFRFKEFGEKMVTSYDASLQGQFYQFTEDYNHKDDFIFSNNRISTLLLDKNLLKKYNYYNNMSSSLYYLLDFLKRLCPARLIHSMFYYSSQLQPFNTIVCGELYILIAESLFRDLSTLINKKPDITVVTMLSDRIHTLFSTAFRAEEFVRLVKEYMRLIDPFYKVKTDNVDYFKKLFSSENTKLIV